MKHTPKPNGSRWMMRNGVDISGPLGAGERDASIGILTDGKHFWRADGTWIHAAGNHPLDLLYPVTVTPLPDPEQEEPKPPKEVWFNFYEDGSLNGPFNTEEEANKSASSYRLRITGHAIRYVLPDEAERGFSEEEQGIAWGTWQEAFCRVGARAALNAALSTISQHRSKKPS